MTDEVIKRGRGNPRAISEDGEEDPGRKARRQERRRAAGSALQLPKALLERLPVARRERQAPAVIPDATGRIEQRLTVLPFRQVPQTGEALEGQVVTPRPWYQVDQKFGERIWFALCVALPVVISTLYYVFIASNQYVAEFRFAVKDASSQSSAAAASSFLAMLGSGGGSAAYDNYLVADYLLSRQATEELQNRINITQLYAKREGDWWARFNPSQPMEKFVAYWQGMVSSHYDQVTGIAIAQVRAFTPADALLIANTLVTLSEDLVNRIANRTQTDAVRFTQREVDKAEERLRAIRAKLTEFRNRVGVLDPAASVVGSNTSLTSSLRAALSQLETQTQTLRLQNLQPNAPAMITLQNQINSTKEQLAIIEGSVGRNKSGEALSTVIAEYEQLDLERQFAQGMVTSTMAALDQARAAAASQHLYITPYVRPSLPESSLYPRRFLSIMTIALTALIIWLVGLMVGRAVAERLG